MSPLRALIALLFISCKAKQEPLPVAVAPDAGTAAIVVDASRNAEPQVKPGQRVELSSAQVALRTNYGDALSRGRKATVAKNYAGAIAAFDEALEKKPKDARALAEKGYAELLDGKLDAARDDLEEASKNVVQDDDLLGQILFNQALVAEKNGNAEIARAYYARVARIRPSKAVDAKLAGKSRCTAVIAKSKVPTFATRGSSHSSGTWVSSWSEMASRIDGATLSDADAKKSLCPACAGAGPWTITRPLMYSDANVYYVVPRGTRMLVVEDSVGGCRCQSGVACLQSKAEVKNDLLVVTSDVQALDAFEVKTDAGDSFYTCKDGAKTHTEAYYDLATDDVVDVSTDKQTVTLDAKTVVVSGDGCSERVPLP